MAGSPVFEYFQGTNEKFSKENSKPEVQFMNGIAGDGV